jgi:hypothetical protein
MALSGAPESGRVQPAADFAMGELPSLEPYLDAATLEWILSPSRALEPAAQLARSGLA